jgi:putative ABC transport system permease protein
VVCHGRFHMTRFHWFATAIRFAWRDLRNSRTSTVFIIFTMVVSLAGVGGVESAAEITRGALHGNTKAWLAGDLAVDLREPISPRQASALDDAAVSGIRWTVVSSGLTLAASDESPDPGLISVKAVDPAAYPFYGVVTLSPSRPLADALQADTAVVSEEVLDRLEVRIGERIRIAGQTFRIAGVIKGEPDRFSGSGALAVGMRCIVSRKGYERSGLDLTQNSTKNRVLLRIPNESDPATVRGWLEDLFPGGNSRDYRNAYRQQNALTEEVLTFLSITALLALVLGAIGLGIAIRHQAERSLVRLAVLRVLGARSTMMMSIFLFQIAGMIAVSLLIGFPLGFFTRDAILTISAKYINLPAFSVGDYGQILTGAGIGLAAMFPALLPAARLVLGHRPAVVLRQAETGNQAEKPAVRSHLAPRLALETLVVTAACGTVWLAARHMLGSPRAASIVAAAIALTAGLTYGLTYIALRQLRRWTSGRSGRRTPLVRHGLAALCRPLNRAQPLIAALATALTLMMATFQTSSAVAHAVFEALPYDRDALYIAGFKDSHRDRLREFLRSEPDVEAVEMLIQARLQLKTLDGLTLEQLRRREKPGVTIGASYLAVCENGYGASADDSAQLTLADDVARQLNAKIGSRLEFEAQDRTIQTVVTSIRRLEPAERIWSTLRLNCGELDESSLLHLAALRTRAGSAAKVREAIREKYPTLPVVTSEEITDTIRAVSLDAMTLARVVGWYAIVASLCILVSVVAVSRTARLREFGILSVLGARRRFIIGMYTTEFASIGFLAGLIASLLTSGFASVALSLVFHHAQAVVDWKAIVAAVFAPVPFTIIAGWIPAWGILNRKPLEVLRYD